MGLRRFVCEAFFPCNIFFPFANLDGIRREICSKRGWIASKDNEKFWRDSFSVQVFPHHIRTNFVSGEIQNSEVLDRWETQYQNLIKKNIKWKFDYFRIVKLAKIEICQRKYVPRYVPSATKFVFLNLFIFFFIIVCAFFCA